MVKKLFVLLGVVAVGALMIPSVIAGSATNARVSIQPVFDSGVHAKVKFIDTGTELKATGEATGLKANGTYISLLYDIGSSGKGLTAAGIEPCETTLTPAEGGITFPQMFMGTWEPMGSTKRHLVVTNLAGFDSMGNPILTVGPKTGVFYTAIGTFKSMSVRRLDAQFALHACGTVINGEVDTDK